MRTLAATSILLLGALSSAQTPESVSNSRGPSAHEDRLLFPHNFIRGYMDFEIAPSHNEPDLGICAPPQGTVPTGAQHCGAYARYVWSGYFEIQPLGRTPLKRLFLFAAPKLFAGDNIPQQQYTASASAILWENTLGAGVSLPRGFEFRLTHHKAHLLGRYGGRNNTLILRPDGPYGLYTTVGVRWYFGGYGHPGPR